MRIRPEDLSRRLSRGALAPVYFVFGSEPLQIEESLDAIRSTARAQGHDERIVLHADTGFDWSELRQYQDSLSLFAEKRLIDLRLSRSKPERAGAEALLHYAERPNPDCVLLLSAGALDWREQRARWYRALDSAGAVVQTWPVPPRQLPRWIAERGRRRGLAIAGDAAAALADRVEGNLLAAAQEVDKLLLLHGRGRIDLDDALASSADNSRYGAFDAGDAAMAGNAVRALLFRIGESHAGEENWLQAVDYLREADRLYDLPMIGQTLREGRRQLVGEVVPSDEIVKTLTDPLRARVQPRVDLHINFEFDSASMTRTGRAQADQLGEAMREIAEAARRLPEWLLVGHTDARGNRSYNEALSVRRAREVRAYLADEFGFDARDIDVEGRGENELLDPEMTEAAHSVNRRVEVVATLPRR